MVNYSYNVAFFNRVNAVGIDASLRADRKTMCIRDSLKAVEEMLDSKHFIRTHQSYIVNIRKITYRCV